MESHQGITEEYSHSKTDTCSTTIEEYYGQFTFNSKN